MGARQRSLMKGAVGWERENSGAVSRLHDRRGGFGRGRTMKRPISNNTEEKRECPFRTKGGNVSKKAWGSHACTMSKRNWKLVRAVPKGGGGTGWVPGTPFLGQRK